MKHNLFYIRTQRVPRNKHSIVGMKNKLINNV